MAQNYYRPTNKQIAEKYKERFPEVKMVTVDEVFGGWRNAQEKHFKDGGVFDEIYEIQP